MRPDPIKRFDEMVAEHGQMPKTVSLVRYKSFDDWYLPAEDGPSIVADFRDADEATDRFAEELTRRGVKVIGVEFVRSEYDAWRKGQPDTRNLRAEWAIAPEPYRGKKLQLAFVVSADSIGWVVLKAG